MPKTIQQSVVIKAPPRAFGDIALLGACRLPSLNESQNDEANYALQQMWNRKR